MSDARVIGVGNAYRHDDGVGLRVVEVARERIGDSASVQTLDGEPTRLLDAWEGADVAVIVDAVQSGAPAGTVHRIAIDGDAPASGSDVVPARPRAASSHAPGPGEAIALARALGRLPRRLVLYGVEGTDFSEGIGLSDPVDEVVHAIVASIVNDVRNVRS